MQTESVQAIIHPSSVHGDIWSAASKSSMQRACAASLLCKKESIIHNPGHSNDDQAALRVIESLGASTEWLQDGSLLVRSQGVEPVSGTVNCGESGLGIRMFTPIAALSRRPVTLTGEGSLVSRPMDFFDEVLPSLGVQYRSREGKLPIWLQGPLVPHDITIDGSLSSQFLTGLLMAFSSAGAANISIRVLNLKSTPYIDLTLKVMQEFGMSVPENRGYAEFYFGDASNAVEKTKVDYTVEGDWSGAAFLLVAGAIAGDLVVKGLDLRSSQADRKILEALSLARARMDIREDGIRVQTSGLVAFDFDATDCPDLFPPLVSLAAYCEGTSVIKGIGRLTHKESNRAITLQEEFGKMHVDISFHDDNMHIHGGMGVSGATVHSHHDHRIAMACAVAALGAKGDTRIEAAGAVNKSYPDFYQHMQDLGADVVYAEPVRRTR
jgi:3-phosphoshikimate 1-carboxyvinyltransferase